MNIIQVKEASDAVLADLYQTHRKAFMAWFRKHSKVDEDTLSGWYQEAFFIFFENCRQGKLSSLNAEIGTYLIGIGKNLQRDDSKSVWHKRVDKYGLDLSHIGDLTYEDEQTEDDEPLKQAISQLDEKCQVVLNLYYYRNFSMEAIAARLGYKNEAVAKKSKYACLQKLRTLFLEK